MTGRTHDLAAFTVLGYSVIMQPDLHISLATALVALGANLIGGLAPDLDQPTAGLWQDIPAGTIMGRLLHPLFGSHRHISHSLLGIVLFGVVLRLFLDAASSVVLVDMSVVWWAFMIGYISHLVMDTLTKEGVPWLFPVPWSIGFPPLKFLRVTTGKLVETGIIFPCLFLFNIYLYWAHYHAFARFLKGLLMH